MNVDDLKNVDQWICWDNRNGRKTPVGARGGVGSSTDPKTWGSYEEATAYAEANNLTGVGFVFTKDDAFCGVDLDDCITDGTVSDEALEIINELNSYTEISPSGTGVKIFGRCHDILKGRNRDKLEAYTFGRFFAFTGRVLGDQFQLADLSSFMRRACRQPATKGEAAIPRVSIPANYDRGLVERASKYLERLPASIQGQNGDRDLFVACSHLVVRFALNKTDAMTLLMNEFNPRCQPPWDDYDVERKVDQLMLERESDPYFKKCVEPDVVVEAVETEEGTEMVARLLSNTQSEGIPERFIDNLPNGPIRLMYDYILKTSARESRGIAFSGALSWYCGLLAGKVMDDSGTKTNLYTITLAPSSAGKQAPQDAIRNVADAAGSDWVSGKVTSDSAIGSVLKGNSQSLCLWDEVGIFFQKAKGGVQGTITDILLDLWGAVNSKFRLKQYADSEKDIVIDKPCFGFHGWSTSDHFWAGLTRMHLRDGFAGRLLVIDTGARAERKRKKYSDAPKDLVDIDRYWSKFGIGKMQECGLAPRPQATIIEVEEEAEEIFDALWEKVESFDSDDDQAIWGRAPEKSRKIALALACQRGTMTKVTADDAAYACELVEYLTERFVSEARKRLTVGEDYNEARLEAIAELKRRDGVCYWGPLLRAVGCSETLFNKVVRTLETSGNVKVQHSKDGKRKVIYNG